MADMATFNYIRLALNTLVGGMDIMIFKPTETLERSKAEWTKTLAWI